MDRREKAEENYRQKFDEYGLSERFEFLRREWSADHDKRFWSKCKTCGAEFLSWPEVFRGRQKHLLCPKCGAASDGDDIFARSDTARKAAELYADGLEQAEIAERLGCTIWDVGNAAQKYKVVDPNRIRRGGKKANNKRVSESESKVKQYLLLRGFELCEPWKGRREIYTIRNISTGETLKRKGDGLLPHLTSNIGYRSRIKDAYVDRGITIDKLIARDGCRCYICGKKTTFTDKQWGNLGPDYPTIDHVVPLARGGKHCWQNVKVCCGLCNVTKRDELTEDIV